MYSPKIDEELIPALYQQAKAEGVPMTKLVNKLLYKAIYGGGGLHVEGNRDRHAGSSNV